MKLGEFGSVVADLRARLVNFTVHDVRRRPILGLYFVIGAMVGSYLIYLVIVIAKDLRNPDRGAVPLKTATEQGQEAPGTSGTGGGEGNPEASGQGGSAQTQETPTQGTALPAGGEVQQPAVKTGPGGVDRRDWRVYDFPDRCQISFPGTWKESKVPAEKGLIHGIRLELPGVDASIQVYARRREAGEDLVKTLRATMSQKGAQNIEEKKKRIQDLDAVELTGTVADKQMAITIFDHDAESYVVATFIANVKEYAQQRAYYDAVLGTCITPKQREQREGISLHDLEQSIQKGLQQTDESLVGTMVEFTLANGSTQRGVVVAEDESSYTLENYRFGGRYSFKVKKKDVVKISR
ncbi:MAG TPA: hypothetical protein VMU60_00610 [Syntrophobacteria bacterium]|nr:hypothetical protein [Syntrophobacteria bacterium]